MTLHPALEQLPQRPAVLGVLAVGGYVGCLSWAMSHWPYDYWGGLLVAPALLLLSWSLFERMGRREGDPWIAKVLLLGLTVKLVVSVLRYQSIFTVYEGSGDASVYNKNGRRLAPLYWEGHYDAKLGWPHFVGAGFIIVVTAIVYMLVGPTLIGGFMVFAWISFVGLLLAYRAFRIAVPEGDHRRYLVLLTFFPSMLFWPSSIGKEAWMLLTLGLCLNGAARLFTHRRGGYLVLLLGLSAAIAVRPHIAAITVVGLAIGYAVRAPRRRTSLTPIVRFGGLALVLALAVLVTFRAASFLGIEDVSLSGVSKSIDDQSARTATGNSNFSPAPATNPANLPKALITVLFRPFPMEAHNTQALIASIEGLLAILILARSWRALLGLPRLLRRNPYVVMCLVFVFAFVIAFSAFSNFGILARERTQLWPVVFALACVPRPLSVGSQPEELVARRRDFVVSEPSGARNQGAAR